MVEVSSNATLVLINERNSIWSVMYNCGGLQFDITKLIRDEIILKLLQYISILSSRCTLPSSKNHCRAHTRHVMYNCLLKQYNAQINGNLRQRYFRVGKFNPLRSMGRKRPTTFTYEFTRFRCVAGAFRLACMQQTTEASTHFFYILR